MRKLLFVQAMLGLVMLACPAAGTEKAKDNPKEEQALKERSEQFVAAFDKGDAKALAEFWTADGDYVDQAGHALNGRKAIEADFKKQFAAAKGAKLRIMKTALRLINGDLAIEDGTTEVLYPNDTPPHHRTLHRHSR